MITHLSMELEGGERKAPLASMEDLSQSQFNTPQLTPAPSPRTRQRWSHRSSLGVILDESEEDEEEQEEEEEEDQEDEEEFGRIEPMPVLSLRREGEKALLLPDGAHHHQSIGGDPFKLRNGNTGRNKYRNQAGKMFWSPPSSSTNIPPTPPPRQLLSSPLSRPLSPSLSQTRSPPPPPRGPPSPMPASPPSPLLTVEETQFLTPRRPKQSQVGYPKRKFRRRGEANGGTQESAYMQLREASNGVERRLATDRCALVFLSFLFHGFAAALPLALLLVSETFRAGLVGGCSPWMSSPPNLLLVLVSFHLFGALPASLLPVRWFPLRTSLSLTGLIISLLLLLFSVMASLDPHLLLLLLLLHFLLGGVHTTSVFGLASKLPSIYPGAVLLGTSVSGVVASLLSCAQTETRLATRITLIYGLILLLAAYLTAFDIHFALPLNLFYQRHIDRKPPSHSKVPPFSLSHLHLFLSSLITHMILPSVLHTMAPLAPSWQSSLHFSSLLGFANFHLAFATGVFAAVFSLLPSCWLLLLLTLVRIILLPLLLFANIFPDRRRLPVLLTWDWTLILTITLSGLLAGYLTTATFFSSLGSNNGVMEVNKRSQSRRAMRSYLVLLAGTLAGAALALAIPTLLQIETR